MSTKDELRRKVGIDGRGYPKRRVIEVVFTTTRYNRRGEGSNKFTLECGHITFAKASFGEPQFKRCRECALTGEAKGATV